MLWEAVVSRHVHIAVKCKIVNFLKTTNIATGLAHCSTPQDTCISRVRTRWHWWKCPKKRVSFIQYGRIFVSSGLSLSLSLPRVFVHENSDYFWMWRTSGSSTRPSVGCGRRLFWTSAETRWSWARPRWNCHCRTRWRGWSLSHCGRTRCLTRGHVAGRGVTCKPVCRRWRCCQGMGHCSRIHWIHNYKNKNIKILDKYFRPRQRQIYFPPDVFNKHLNVFRSSDPGFVQQ